MAVTAKAENQSHKLPAATHTPGPWTATRQIEVHDDSHLDEVYYSVDLDTANQPGTKHHAYIARVDGMRDERMEANARLIASAPEMLEALEDIAQMPLGSHAARRVADAAIRRAKGEGQ